MADNTAIEWTDATWNPVVGCSAPCHAEIYLDVLKTEWPERWKRQYPRICDEVKPLKQRKD